MSDIATFLGSSFKEVEVRSKFAQYRIRTVTLASNIKLENYLDKFPLFSSKYLNYKDWLKVLEFKKIAAASVRSTVGTKYDADFLDKVVKIINGMTNYICMGSSTRVLQTKKIIYSPIHYVGSGVSTLKEAYSKWECLPFFLKSS